MGVDPNLSDAEGGPGEFIGGHTGHAAADFEAQMEAERRAAQDPPAPEADEYDEYDYEASFEQRDMDADIEDLDA